MKTGWSVEQLGGAKGRGVVSRRTFNPGDLVLEDRAYAHAVVAGELGGVCDCCLAPCSGPLRCSACKLVCYTSKEHQARAWRAGHREECAALRACAPRVPPTAVRLALRCVLRHWRAQQQRQQQGSEDALVLYDALLQLQHHWDVLSEGSKLQFAQMGSLAHRLLETAAREAAVANSPRDLALLLARFGANSHTISDDELRPRAVAIFPLGALVNHDCLPNTVHSFVGDRMLFRAVRTIQPGEEVTTAYTELAATRWERRRELLRHHQFDIDSGTDTQTSGEVAAAEAGAASNVTHAGSSVAAASGGASAAGDPAASAAALLCLPAQQPAMVLPLAGGAADLRLYNCQLPPWPHDVRDAALTAVVAATLDGAAGHGSGSSGSSGSRGSSGSSSSSGGGAWGGMWGSLGLTDDASLAATPASASFDVAADLTGEAGVAAGQQPSSAAGPSSVPSAGQPAASPAVHSWPAVGGAHLGGSQLALQQLAEAYLAALQLQQALDGMLAAGQAAAAVQRLQQVLTALCSLSGGADLASGQPSSCVSSSSSSSGGKFILGPRHVLRMRLLADLHRAAVAAEQWEVALAAACELLPLYRQIYPPAWPQVGLLWAAVAKLEHLQERPERAMHAAEQALHVFTTTQGGSGPAAEAMRQVLFEAGQEAAMRGGGGTGRASLAAAAGSDSDEY